MSSIGRRIVGRSRLWPAPANANTQFGACKPDFKHQHALSAAGEQRTVRFSPSRRLQARRANTLGACTLSTTRSARRGSAAALCSRPTACAHRPHSTLQTSRKSRPQRANVAAVASGGIHIKRSWPEQKTNSPTCLRRSRQIWVANCGSRCSKRAPRRRRTAKPCHLWSMVFRRPPC